MSGRDRRCGNDGISGDDSGSNDGGGKITGGVADGRMAEWRRKLQEILDDAERRDGRVRRRGGRPKRNVANGVAGNGGADGANGGKTAGCVVVTCGAGILRKEISDGENSENGGADGSDGRGVAVTCGEAANGLEDSWRSGVEGSGTRGDAGSVGEGRRTITVEVRRVTQAALVLALEAVSEPLWALVKSLGSGDGVQSA